VGNGTVDQNPVPPYYVGDDTLVTLTANPASGWSFSGWSGDLVSTNNPDTITMDNDKTITATFTHNTYTLTVNILGNGTVTQDPLPPYYVGEDKLVTLTVNPAADWNFSKWSGDLIGSANPTNITMNGNKTVTATFKKEGSGSGGGGGGGGGGGSGDTTSLTEFMTDSGEFVVDANAESADSEVKIYIPKGTIGKNPNGKRLNFISIKKQSAPPAPPDDHKFICLTYDIIPNGSTFDPFAYLIFKYNDSQIPVGVAEEDLVIATWQDGKWVELEGCVVDPVNNTITVPISHFSIFTVIANTAAAKFEVTSMTITPTEVNPDESITVSAIVTNNGGLAGSYDVTLKINNVVSQSKKVTLDGGKSQTISFTVTPDTSGEYTVGVNGLSGKFTVKKPVPEGTVAEIPVPTPAKFTIFDLSITPDEANPSEEVTISAVVTNVGGSKGSYTVVLKIDNKEEARKEILLNPGKSERVSFNTTKDKVGSHTIDINGHTGQFTITEKIIPSVPAQTTPAKPETTHENNWGLIAGLIAVVIVVIALLLYFTWWRKRRVTKQPVP